MRVSDIVLVATAETAVRAVIRPPAPEKIIPRLEGLNSCDLPAVLKEKLVASCGHSGLQRSHWIHSRRDVDR